MARIKTPEDKKERPNKKDRFSFEAESLKSKNKNKTELAIKEKNKTVLMELIRKIFSLLSQTRDEYIADFFKLK
jgi:hypothetical protein